MARKLILVDEDKYRALISPHKSTTAHHLEEVDGVPNLKFIKSNLNKTKKARNRNLSAKNVNYQQELRRYLRARKELLDKPIKVTLKNGLRLLVRRRRNKNGASSSDSFVTASLIGEDGLVDEDEEEVYLTADDDDDDNNETLKADDEDDDRRSTRSPEDFSPEFNKIPLHPSTSSFSGRKFARRYIPAIVEGDPLAEQLYEYIMQEPSKFGVSQSGHAFRGTKMMPNSDIGEIVHHMFNQRPGSMSPTGFKYVFAKLKKDPLFIELMRQRHEKDLGVATPLSRKFKPAKWT